KRRTKRARMRLAQRRSSASFQPPPFIPRGTSTQSSFDGVIQGSSARIKGQRRELAPRETDVVAEREGLPRGRPRGGGSPDRQAGERLLLMLEQPRGPRLSGTAPRISRFDRWRARGANFSAVTSSAGWGGAPVLWTLSARVYRAS